MNNPLKPYIIKRNISFIIGLVCIICIFQFSFWFIIPTAITVAYGVLLFFAIKHLNKLCNHGNRIIDIEGAPRSGKDDSGTTIAVYLAYKQYTEIKRFVRKKAKKYKKVMLKIDKTQYCSDEQEVFILDYHERIKTIAYYETQPHLIPCLVSNLKIKEQGRVSADLDYDYVTMSKLLPFGTVLYVSEKQSLFPMIEHKDRKNLEIKNIANMFERIGHYIDGYLVQNGQDADNENKDLRRLSPFTIKYRKAGAKFLKYLGLRKFEYKRTDRVNDGEQVVRTSDDDGYRTLYLPCGIGKYNDRHLRKLYPPKEEIIEMSAFGGFILEDTEENRKIYSRDVIKNGEAKKRERYRTL